MISGGVTFQPGQAQGTGAQPKPKGGSVQEAIKILSLRLPKQVGPNALAPSALLNAQGSGGNPRVDSVVNTVMNRMFPTGPAPGGAPVLGPSMGENGTMPVSSPVRMDGNTRPTDNTPLSSMMPSEFAPIARAPRITPVEEGGDAGTPRGMPGTVPETPPPPQRIDFGSPAQPADPIAPTEPTQDPWNDLMEYLRRNQAPPAPQQPFEI